MNVTRQTEERVRRCFENIGIFISPDENILLAECIEDSLTFISLLVEIEQTFGISIPDEYFNNGRLQTCQDIYNMVAELTHEESIYGKETACKTADC